VTVKFILVQQHVKPVEMITISPVYKHVPKIL